MNEENFESSGTGQDDFLGLSQEQMSSIVQAKFNENSRIVKLDLEVDPEELVAVPLIEQSLLYMEIVRKAGGIKATERGNLPPEVVNEIYDKFFGLPGHDQFLNDDEDFTPIFKLRGLHHLAGLVEEKDNAFIITGMGEEILDTKNVKKLYEILFITFAAEYNWLYDTEHGETMYLVQMTLVFDLLMIKKLAVDFIPGETFGRCYLKAFPSLMPELQKELEEDYAGERENAGDEEWLEITSPIKEVSRCLELCFLTEFAMELGLVDVEMRDEKPYFKKSALFDKIFSWKI